MVTAAQHAIICHKRQLFNIFAAGTTAAKQPISVECSEAVRGIKISSTRG
ncbi:MAG: hypothetical protein ACOC6R_02425 [Chloroflexota bacterium]